MHVTKKIGKGLVLTTAIVLMAMPVWAGNGKGSGTGNGSGSGTRSRLRDNSCPKVNRHAELNPLLTKNILGDYILLRKRLKDGSCLPEEEA